MPEILWAMDVFAELVVSSGPLCGLRFDASHFSRLVGAIAQPLTEAWIEQAFAAHIEKLAGEAFLTQMRQTLQKFCGLDFVDATHKVAARTALTLLPKNTLAGGAQGRDAPCLYAIFRAQCLQAANMGQAC